MAEDYKIEHKIIEGEYYGYIIFEGVIIIADYFDYIEGLIKWYTFLTGKHYYKANLSLIYAKDDSIYFIFKDRVPYYLATGKIVNTFKKEYSIISSEIFESGKIDDVFARLNKTRELYKGVTNVYRKETSKLY